MKKLFKNKRLDKLEQEVIDLRKQLNDLINVSKPTKEPVAQANRNIIYKRNARTGQVFPVYAKDIIKETTQELEDNKGKIYGK